MGPSLFSLHVPSGSGGRARYEVSMGCIFPWGLLAVTARVGNRSGVEGARARTRCELGLLLCSMAITALSGVGLGPEGLE